MQGSHAEQMGNAPIQKILWKLAIPGIVGMLVNAIYNIVDTLFVGGLNNTQAIGAVAVAFPLMMMVSSFGQMFGIGANSYIARLLGAGKKQEADHVAATTFWTALVSGLVVTALGLIFMEPILKLFGATATIMPYAKGYSNVIVMFSTLFMINMTMNNMIRAEGNPKYSMIALSAGAIINIILDPIFIFTLGYGVQGAAIATVIGQVCATGILLSYYLRGKSLVHIGLKYVKPSKEIYTEVLKIGVPSFARQVLISISMGMLNSAAMVFGDAAVAAMGVIMRVFSMALYVAFGFIQGFMPLAAFNYGAKKFDRLKEAISISTRTLTILSTVAAVVMFFFAQPIIAAFSRDPEVVAIGVKGLKYMTVLLPFFGFQMVWSTVFQSLGKGKEAMILSMARQGIFLIPAILILPSWLGLAGVLLCQPVADFFTILITAPMALKEKKLLDGQMEFQTA